MGEDFLSLKWNNHKPAFFHLLRILREKGCYTDVTLACGAKFFAVHRLVLMACSDFFTEVFEHTQCQKPVIVLKDIKSHELEALLDYMYLGEVDVQQTDLPGLIKAAECLRIKGLAVPDEDPSQPLRPEAPMGGERPAKRRRQDREARDSDRGTTRSHSGDRGCHGTPAEEVTQYGHHRTEVMQGGGEVETSNKCIIPQADDDASHLTTQEASVVQRTDSLHVQQESEVSPTRIHDVRMHHDSRMQHDMRAHDSRSQPEPRIQHESHVQHDIEVYSQNAAEIKTEHCDINEEMENGGLKSEISEIQGDPMNESSGGGGDFSHFLSVEENLAHHMFQTAHQAGPSGVHRAAGRDSSSEVSGEDGSGNRGGVGGSMYPSHLLGDIAPEGAATLSNQSATNGCGVSAGVLMAREVAAHHHCPYCPQSFMFQSILKRHLRTHTGEKPYECPSCDYRSAYKYHVARHMKLHNPQLQPRTEGALIMPPPPAAATADASISSSSSSSSVHNQGLMHLVMMDTDHGESHLSSPHGTTHLSSPHGTSHLSSPHVVSHLSSSHGASHLSSPHGTSHLSSPHGASHLSSPHGASHLSSPHGTSHLSPTSHQE